MKKNIFLMILMANIICNCRTEHDYPKLLEEEKIEKSGSFFDINSKIFEDKETATENQKSSKNKQNLAKENRIILAKQHYWQAALSVVSSKKIHFTDFAGGIIVTDWYQKNIADDKRYKLVIMIDAENSEFEPILKIVAHEQEMINLVWVDKLNNKEVAEKVRKEITDLLKK